MKLFVNILLSFSSLLFFNYAQAQRFEVPKNYSFDSKNDYKKYEDNIISCINWLEKNYSNENNSKVRESTNFLLEWSSGCPYINIPQNLKIDALFNESPELRVFYTGGWVKNAVKTKLKSNKTENCVAGLKAVIKMYNDDHSIKRNPKINELVKLDEHAGLNDWVEERIR